MKKGQGFSLVDDFTHWDRYFGFLQFFDTDSYMGQEGPLISRGFLGEQLGEQNERRTS